MLTDRYNAVFGPWSDIWLRGGWRVQTHCVTGQARALDPKGACIAAGEKQFCLAAAARLAPGARAKQAAVLLHGLWNGPGIMDPLSQALEEAGWAVANIAYPSRRLDLAAHGAAASHVAIGLAEDGAREIAFVGHSLGGLVARMAMAKAAAAGWRAGRLVLIGSPARGSAIAGRCQHLPGYANIIGACGHAVTPAGALAVPPPDGPGLLVIAGGNGGRGYNPLIAGDDDGLIAVSETRLPERETEFRLVRSLHRSLPLRPETISACRDFLGSEPVRGL